MKKLFLIISFFIFFPLFSSQVTQEQSISEEKRTCLICLDDITDPLFDRTQPITRSHLTCPPDITMPEQDHTNSYCLGCLETHLLRTPNKACPHCRTPGKILTKKRRTKTDGAPVFVIQPNKKDKTPQLKFIFSSQSMNWNPCIFLCTKEEIPPWVEIPLSQADFPFILDPYLELSALLFARWTTITNKDPEKIRNLENSYPPEAIEKKLLRLLLEHKLTDESQTALNELSQDLKLINKFRPFYRTAFQEPLEAEMKEIEDSVEQEIEKRKLELKKQQYEEIEIMYRQKNSELTPLLIKTLKEKQIAFHKIIGKVEDSIDFWGNPIRVYVEYNPPKICSDDPETQKIINTINKELLEQINKECEEEAIEINNKNTQTFHTFMKQCSTKSQRKKEKIVAKIRWHTVRKKVFSEEEIQGYLALKKMLNRYTNNRKIILEEGAISTKTFPLKNESKGLACLTDALQDPPQGIITRFTCPQRIITEE